MKVRKAIKSIMALGTGLTLLGATVFGAVAADLGAYPGANFVKDGKFNGLMVVGAKAKTDDVLGVVDIATSLQFSTRKQVSVTGTTTTDLSGDVYEFGTNADILELNEYLGDVKSTLTEDELGALASSKLRTSKGTTDADQYLKFNDTNGLKIAYTDNKDRIVSDYLMSTDKEVIFTYELQFPEGLKSDVYDDSTTSDKASTQTTTYEYLQDIEDEQLNILGDTFDVVEAKISNTSVKLTLMGGAASDTLKEGETKTYNIDGNSYEVTVVIIADADSNANLKTKLMINGEVTKQLSEGDTDTLDDGTVIGINDILGNEGAEEGGDDIVSFYIGANKIVLEDTAKGTASFTGSMKVDEETIEDADVDIQATWSGEESEISSISFKLKVDSKQTGDMYIAEGDSLRNMLDEPEGMFSTVWDVVYAGLAQPSSSLVEITPSGDDIYYLNFESQEGLEYEIPLVDNSEGVWNIGTDNENLIYKEATSGCITNAIALEDYFILNSDSDDDKAFTKVLTFDDVETPSGSTSGKITFSDISEGSTKTVSFASTIVDNTATNASTTLNVGGKSYVVTVITTDSTTESAYSVCLDLDNDGLFTLNDASDIVTKNGAKLVVSGDVDAGDGNASNYVSFNVITPGKYMDENSTDQTFSINVTSSGATTYKKVDVDYTANTGVNLERKSNKGEDDVSGMTNYGIIVEEDVPTDSDDPDTLRISIPESQVYGQVFVTGGDTSASTSSTGATYGEVQRIEVGKAVLDNEINNVAADNLIVVGGPCVNTVAATLLGISGAAPACYEDFPVDEGAGIIKMVDNGDNVAIVVAGYSAADTRNAAQVIANYGDYAEDLAGKDEVVVAGTQIMAPTVAAEDDAEDAE